MKKLYNVVAMAIANLFYYLLTHLLTSLVPRPHPLMRRNGLGELSQISWTSARFCDSVTWQRSKYLCQTAQQSTDTEVEMNIFYCCKGSAT